MTRANSQIEIPRGLALVERCIRLDLLVVGLARFGVEYEQPAELLAQRDRDGLKDHGVTLSHGAEPSC